MAAAPRFLSAVGAGRFPIKSVREDMPVSSLQPLLRLIVQEIPSAFGVLVRVGKDGRIKREAIWPPPGRESWMVNEGMVLEAVTAGNPVVLPGPRPPLPAEEGGAEEEEGPQNALCLPLFGEGSPNACFYLVRNGEERAYSEKELRLLTAFSGPARILLEGSGITESRRGRRDEASPFVGRSRDFIRILRMIEKVKNSDVPVFIAGESGTGKELVARAVHGSGRRKNGPFVALNCGAIPDHLLESELFGHARGAFTGALRHKPGLIEEAHLGTFFLDEVGDLSLNLQAKLLRVLQEREIRRIGENRTRSVDVRFISATNKDIEREVQKGRFREDLYYRLKIVSLELPPLRERKEDIPCLLQHFVEKYCRELGRETAYFSPDAMHRLLDYSWPGNVRELQNEIQRCLILCGKDSLIKEEHLSPRVRGKGGPGSNDRLDYFRAKAQFERSFLNEALARSNYNRTRTAAEVGLSRQGLFKLMKKHGLFSSSPEETGGPNPSG